MDGYSIAQSIVIILIVLGLVRLLPAWSIHPHPCGNKKCKRIKIEKDGTITQNILEGLQCPICKEQFLLIIKETENVADIGGK